jgi:hypothetical protein
MRADNSREIEPRRQERPYHWSCAHGPRERSRAALRAPCPAPTPAHPLRQRVHEVVPGAAEHSRSKSRLRAGAASRSPNGRSGERPWNWAAAPSRGARRPGPAAQAGQGTRGPVGLQVAGDDDEVVERAVGPPGPPLGTGPVMDHRQRRGPEDRGDLLGQPRRGGGGGVQETVARVIGVEGVQLGGSHEDNFGAASADRQAAWHRHSRWTTSRSRTCCSARIAAHSLRGCYLTPQFRRGYLTLPARTPRPTAQRQSHQAGWRLFSF